VEKSKEEIMDLVPGREEAIGQLEPGKVVTLHAALISDMLTPISAFARLQGKYQDAYLLESVEGGEKIGRLSIIGLGSARRYSYADGCFCEEADGRIINKVETNHPIRELRRVLNNLAVESADIGVAFNGGAVGYISYEAVRTFEDIKLVGETRFGGFPEIDFRVAELLLVFDHVMQRLHLMTYIFGDDQPAAAYDQAVDRLRQLHADLTAPAPIAYRMFAPMSRNQPEKISGTANFTRPEFEAAVRRCLEYIRAGDIFQVVLSQRWRYPSDEIDPVLLYRALRVINPSPYMFFYKSGEQSIIGSSPEILVRLEGRQAVVRPIAGTRPRGKDPEGDCANAAELLADPKECAEHIMLVDLGRNDLGRVCDYGSVKPTELLAIERYSHVMHIVSHVVGQLREGYDAFDLLEAAFPAGTVSGAPKIRAMEIINELEPGPRGPYAGAVGYFGFDGNLDTCIAIRTVFIDGRDLYLQAGAGIVADSDPGREWEETVNKARGMQMALDWVERQGSRGQGAEGSRG